MVELVPVDHDPFSAAEAAGIQLVPVDHDPFAEKDPGFLGEMAGNFRQGVQNIKDVATGNYEDIGAGRSTPKTEALADKLLQGNTDPSVLGVTRSAFSNLGNTTPSDFAGALLEKFNNTPEGKIVGAIGGINPLYNATGTFFNRTVNPAIADATGASPDTIQLMEMLAGTGGLKKAAAISDPNIAVAKYIGNKLGGLGDAKEVYSIPGEPLIPPKAHGNALNILKQALSEEGIAPADIINNLREAQQTGLPLSALDVATKDVGGVQTQGRNLLGLADAAANMPGESSAIAGDLASRGYMAKQRIGNAFDKAIANNDFYKIQNDAIQNQKGAGPLYDEAFSQNSSIQSPAIDRILRTPAGLSALKSASIKMQNDMSMMGISDPELVEQAKLTGQYVPGDGGLAAGLKLRSLDYVKRALDDQIGAAKRAGENDNVRILSGLKNNLIKEMDNADATDGKYAQARATHASGAQVKDALEQGRNFLSMDPEEISAFIKDKHVSNPEKAAFSTGVRRALQDKMGNVGDNANAVTALWKQNIRDRLEPLFPDKASFEDFAKRMEHEQTMARVNGLLTRGSQTNMRGTYQDLINQSPVGDAMKAFKVMKSLTNPQSAAIDAARNFLSKSVQKAAKGMSNDTAAGIMHYLGTSNPDIWMKLIEDPETRAALSNPQPVNITPPQPTPPLSLSPSLAAPAIAAGTVQRPAVAAPVPEMPQPAPEAVMAPQSSNEQQSPEELKQFNKAEGTPDYNAVSPHKGASTTYGAYQFQEKTLNGLINKYGKQLSIDKSNWRLPENQDKLAQALRQENAKVLRSALGREPTNTDLYVAHFLGANDARKFFKNLNSKGSAAAMLPAVAQANRGRFFKNGRPLTPKGVYMQIAQEMGA